VPYGGGAIMNELDGNLTLWYGAAYQLKFWHNKVRGPEFEPRHFQIEKISCPDIVDVDGRQIMLPVLRPTTEQNLEDREEAAANSGIALLRAMAWRPDAPISEWMQAIGIKSKRAIYALLGDLKKDKLVETAMRKWIITKKGKAMALEITNDH
jgi:hypothetical protein